MFSHICIWLLHEYEQFLFSFWIVNNVDIQLKIHIKSMTKFINACINLHNAFWLPSLVTSKMWYLFLLFWKAALTHLKFWIMKNPVYSHPSDLLYIAPSDQKSEGSQLEIRSLRQYPPSYTIKINSIQSTLINVTVFRYLKSTIMSFFCFILSKLNRLKFP